MQFDMDKIYISTRKYFHMFVRSFMFVRSERALRSKYAALECTHT